VRRPNGRGLALAAAVVGAGYAAERLLARRLRGRPDPHAGREFQTLPAARYHAVPTFDGGETYVVECGPAGARPVVLLHGLSLSSAAWHHQLVDLADEFRVVAVDFRGHGRSTAGSEGYGLEHLARDLASVLEHLELRDAILVGHSMGGMVVMRFCIDRPPTDVGRVAGIVLVSTAAGEVTTPFGLAALARVTVPAVRRSTAWLGRVPDGRLLPASDFSYLVTRVGLGRGAEPALVELTRTLMAATSPRAIAGSLPSLVDHDVRHELAAVDLPALVVVGSHDPLTPPRMARRIVEHLPHAELVVLDGIGHMPMLEARTDVDRLIRDFSAKLGPVAH
jgi:pimeloyl-ACP methyl ester carboxylesterase